MTSSFNISSKCSTSCGISTTGGFPNLFASAVQLFAAGQCLLPEGYPYDDSVPNFAKFDFIIVGGGSAGCVVANRLSEIEEWNILLVEAGDDPPIEANVPFLDKSIFKTKYDWQYLTTNDGRTNQANINGSINWIRGKMIGGCSNINAMVYIEGNARDYEIWYKACNLEWSVNNIRRCFQKSQNYQNLHLSEDPKIYEHYGHDGPVVINTFNSTYRSVNDNVLGAWEEIGIKNVPDLNTANVLGSGIMAAIATNGERQSSNKAYLNPVRYRRNLKILKNSFVANLLISRSNKKAYGIEIKSGCKKYKYFATKEIIISAGTINSPQLLLLSGIGPKDHLESKSIRTIVDLPGVGKNLQDHCIVPIIICNNQSNPQSAVDEKFDIIKYLYNRTGYLAQSSIEDIMSFYSSDKNASYPDYQSYLTIIWKNNSNTRSVLTERFRFKNSVVDPIVELNKNYTLFYFGFTILHPKSRGNITLRSKNPERHPFIYPNYFLDPYDLESAVTGIKILTKLLKTNYFISIGAFLARMHWPECDIYELDSRNYWKCVCINMVLTVYHPVGTCAMGTDPRTSVVDSRLRIHGVNNLRVIDASIMPNITSGNTYGPTIMIGERGAELVKEDYNRD